MPIIFETPFILKLWLKEVPEYTVIFTRLVIILALMSQITVGLQIAVQAIGNINRYQSVVGSLIILTLPVSYLLLKLGFPAYSVLIVSISIELIACFFRIFFLRCIGGLSIKKYFMNVIVSIIIPVSVSFIPCYFIFKLQEKSSLRFLITSLSSIVVFFLSVYFLGLSKTERQQIKKIFDLICIKLRIRKANG